MSGVNDLGCFRRSAAERMRGGITYYEEEASCRQNQNSYLKNPRNIFRAV